MGNNMTSTFCNGILCQEFFFCGFTMNNYIIGMGNNILLSNDLVELSTSDMWMHIMNGEYKRIF